jgi:H+-transporting ATPase
VSAGQQPAPAEDITAKGLTSDEARARLEKDGSNAMPDTSAHPFRNALAKLWAPVPWLLEASIVLELLLHKYLSIISASQRSKPSAWSE